MAANLRQTQAFPAVMRLQLARRAAAESEQVSLAQRGHTIHRFLAWNTGFSPVHIPALNILAAVAALARQDLARTAGRVLLRTLPASH